MSRHNATQTKDHSPLLTINNIPIHFSEDWNTGIGGGLWSLGLAMAKYFDAHSKDIATNLKLLGRLKHLRQITKASGTNNQDGEGISAIELGSGNGFLSVCLLAAVTRIDDSILKKLVVTDMADHLALMRRTLDVNSHVCNRLSAGAADANDDNKVKVTVEEHIWGSFTNQTDAQQKYDFIFGTDLAYRDYLYEPLISSLTEFSHEHTLSLIGVTMNDTCPRFFDLLTKAGFRYERLTGKLDIKCCVLL
jgi:hypothetical protein